MSYDNAILEAKAVDAVRKYNLISIEEVVLHLPCCRKTFYRKELHKCPLLKRALENNKIRLKSELRKKWAESKSATLNIALYKLLANKDELARLNNNEIHSTKDKGQVILVGKK